MSRLFASVRKLLQMSISYLWVRRKYSPLFAQVAARLLHTEHARQDSNLQPFLLVTSLQTGRSALLHTLLFVPGTPGW